MNTDKPDNPPAFPHDKIVPEQAYSSLVIPAHPGMTMRDWFAGQALAGTMASGRCISNAPEWVPGYCYDVADAMLAEREAGSKPCP